MSKESNASETPFTQQDEFRERAAAHASDQPKLVISDSTVAASDSATIPDNQSILPERASNEAYASSVTYYGSSKEESQRTQPVDPPVREEVEGTENHSAIATVPLWGWLIAALLIGLIVWQM